MAREATRFLAEIIADETPRWLAFLGPSGTGKTMLSKLIMRFIRKHCLLFTPGYGITLTDQAYIAKWPNMVREMKAGDFGSCDQLSEKETKWNGKENLTFKYALIDDIGHLEDSSKSYILSAIGRVADNRIGSWTIWTSNLLLEQIGKIVDPRLASRMIRGGNVVVELPLDFPDFNIR